MLASREFDYHDPLENSVESDDLDIEEICQSVKPRPFRNSPTRRSKTYGLSFEAPKSSSSRVNQYLDEEDVQYSDCRYDQFDGAEYDGSFDDYGEDKTNSLIRGPISFLKEKDKDSASRNSAEDTQPTTSRSHSEEENQNLGHEKDEEKFVNDSSYYYNDNCDSYARNSFTDRNTKYKKGSEGGWVLDSNENKLLQNIRKTVNPLHANVDERGLLRCRLKRRIDSDGYGGYYKLFELLDDKTGRPLLVASKSRKANSKVTFHMYDMTRGTAGEKLSKKCGNYVGKLVGQDYRNNEFVLIDNNGTKREVCGILFDHPSIFGLLGTHNNGPVKMNTVLASHDDDRHNIVSSKKVNLHNILKLHSANSFFGLNENLRAFQSKMPTYIGGAYRLNFYGRAKQASLKNFQLISELDGKDKIYCQFGKIEKDLFTLDFQAPFSPMQAFAIALAQFVK